MDNDNKIQDGINPSEMLASEENSVFLNTTESIYLADSTPTDMPSEAPEGSTIEVDMPQANIDNPDLFPIESKTLESSNSPQTMNSNVASATSSFFFRNLLTKARESIQFCKRKKRFLIMMSLFFSASLMPPLLDI